MKILIDIPEDTHERITRPDRLFTDDDVNKICWAVYNGTPIPDNATNGDVMKAMFSVSSVEIVDDFYGSFGVRLNNSNYIQLNKGWWNAPYQKGGKE